MSRKIEGSRFGAVAPEMYKGIKVQAIKDSDGKLECCGQQSITLEDYNHQMAVSEESAESQQVIGYSYDLNETNNSTPLF